MFIYKYMFFTHLNIFIYMRSSVLSFRRWVLLKNVHLAPSWLVTVEKKLHTLTPHPAFRLFMTMEITPKVGTFQINCFFACFDEIIFCLILMHYIISNRAACKTLFQTY